MTWSIVAREESSGNFGIAVASRFFAVGARVPHLRSGVGAVATQALVNSFFGPEGLHLLTEGASAEEVVRRLVAGDSGRDHRQLHVVDASGRTAAHTGAACVDWCGSLSAENFSVAGNMLAGLRVVEDTAAAYAAGAALPFAQRLIRALKAGEDAGGDKRGKQSAALVIYGNEAWADLDMRVDDHADPITELIRLEQVSRERYVYFRSILPRREDRVGETNRQVIDARIAEAIRRANEAAAVEAASG
jgi:uncharacterized Ntn-hydrolase superfamily protein